MKPYSKELYDAMAHFERNADRFCYCASFDREDKEQWLRGNYYQNGTVNNLFRMFLLGYEYVVSEVRTSIGDLIMN